MMVASSGPRFKIMKTMKIMIAWEIQVSLVLPIALVFPPMGGNLPDETKHFQEGRFWGD